MFDRYVRFDAVHNGFLHLVGEVCEVDVDAFVAEEHTEQFVGVLFARVFDRFGVLFKSEVVEAVLLCECFQLVADKEQGEGCWVYCAIKVAEFDD